MTKGCSAPSTSVLQEVTLTYEHRLADGFLVRGEYRRDWSNRAVLHQLGPGRSPTRPGHRHCRPRVVVRQQVGHLVGPAPMTLIAFCLALVAFVYLVYAMLRPERF